MKFGGWAIEKVGDWCMISVSIHMDIKTVVELIVRVCEGSEELSLNATCGGKIGRCRF